MRNCFNDRSDFRRLSIVVGIVCSVLAVSSCQDKITQSQSGPVDVEASFPYTDEWKTPDSLTWAIGSDAHKTVAEQEITSVRISAKFTLPTPTGDSIYMGLWLGGMRFALMPFTQDGESTTLNAHTAIFDSVGKSLIRICSSKTDRNRDTLLARYARGLVDGSPLFVGFPGNCPVGIDTARVVRLALAYAVGKGVALQSMVRSWLIPLDTLGARVLMPELLSLGWVTTAEIAKALPPYPVRLTNSVALSTDPVPGGNPVDVAGRFVWEKGRVVRPSIQVRTAKGIDLTSFHIIDSRTGFVVDTSRLIFPGDTAWDLSGGVALLADSLASSGVDTLVVKLDDGAGHSATAKAVFRVTKPTAPKLVVTSSNDTTVANSTLRIWVSSNVTDSFGPHTFKIQTKTISGPPYGDSVLLEVGPNPIQIEVCNQAKLCSRDTVHVVRAQSPGDIVPPMIGKVNAPRDTTVGYDTRTIDLAWTVWDDSALASVSLDGTTINGVSTLYKTTAALKVGSNTLILLALDAHGNARRDTVQVVRLSDTTKPVVTRATGTSDTTLPPAAGSILVAWNVADNALRSVTLDGTTLHSTSGIYSGIVTLSGKSVHIGITAVDSSGNTTSDSIFVELKDQQGPSIVRVSPASDTTVGNTTQSVGIRLSVKDVSGVDSVKIDGKRVDSSANGDYASTIPFPLYQQDLTIRVTAWDRLGNKTDSVIVFHRRDPVVVSAPKPILVQPASRKGATLASDVDSILVKLSVSGMLKLADTAVRIHGAIARRENDTVWAAMIAVPATGLEYAIAMVATDTSGRTGTDTVWVTRAAPKIALIVAFDSTKGDPSLRQGLYVTTMDSLRISWKVDGNCPGCGFAVDGAKTEFSAGAAAAGVKLPLGESSHELDVSVAGVVVARSVVKIRRYGALSVNVVDGDRDTVGLSDTSGVAVWSVTGAVSVVIDGASQNLSATGLYSKPLTGLRTGANPSTLIAIDSLGDSSIAIGGVHKLAGADLLVTTQSKDTLWDSAAYKISSVTPGVALSWSTDSASWKPVPANGSVVVYRNGRVFAKAACQGYSTVVERTAYKVILHTNSAPTFRKRSDTVPTFEDAGLVRWLWSESVSTGGVWDSAQKVTFVLTPLGDAASYFEVDPAIDSATGILTFKTVKDAFGSLKYRVVLKDNGGTTNSGIDSSTVDTLLIVITGVNDPMSFTATDIADTAQIGDLKTFARVSLPNERWKLVRAGGSGKWVENDKPSFRIFPSNDLASNCFDVAPRVNVHPEIVNGDFVEYYDISYQSKMTCGGGTALFKLRVNDNGGTGNGGVDSASVPLTIQLSDTIRANDGLVHHFRQFGKTVWMLENMASGNIGSVYTAADTASACPTNWRLPRAGEWDTLVSLSNGVEHLRNGFWGVFQKKPSNVGDPPRYDTLRWNADNSTGFGMVPTETSGMGSNLIMSTKAEFWTSTPDKPYAYFESSFTLGSTTNLFSSFGSSVRCVR